MEREIDGFAVETEFGCYASQRQNGRPVGTEIELIDDADGSFFVIEGEHGSGYLRECVTSHVPSTVIAELLRARGWTVMPPERG